MDGGAQAIKFQDSTYAFLHPPFIIMTLKQSVAKLKYGLWYYME